MNPGLIETLRDAQRFGFFGRRPIDEAIAHAMAFVRAAAPLAAGSRIVDLGSGGGLPGLVLAHEFPESSILLVDRRQKRTDFLQLAVLRLGWSHVTVRHDDVKSLVGEVRRAELERFDLVTARGFGPPDTTLRFAANLRADTGRIVISEPPSGDRWPQDLLDDLGLSRSVMDAMAVFVSN